MKFIQLSALNLLILFASNSGFASAPSAEFNRNAIGYRVIPFVTYMESQKVPPDLFVKFNVRCYQTLIKVIREDIEDPVTHKVTIVMGGLVSENTLLPCSSADEVTSFAGSTFSGREFEVRSVQ